MDQGIWAVWFDLEDSKKASHIKWLHETYLPETRALPGIAWTAHYDLHPEIYAPQRARLKHTSDAIGQASQHLVLVAAASPNIFFHKSSPLDPANQSQETKDRFAERKEVRWLVAREDFRVNGPDYQGALPGGTPSPCVQMGSFVMETAESEIGLGQWYEQLRFGEFAKSKSCVRMRKLLGIAGWAKHAVLYEFTSNEDRAQNMEHTGTHKSEWGEKVIAQTVHSPGSPVIGFRQWPKV